MITERFPVPGKGIAEIWLASLDTLSIGAEQAVILDPAEAVRAARYRFDRDRVRYRRARILLRLLLAGYLGMDAARIRFAYGLHGKPRLECETALRFNVSHSSGEAAFAFTGGSEVGVDIERVREIAEMSAISASHFTTGERLSMSDAGERGQTAGFFLCWTRKEAYVKGLGDGLSFPLLSVSLESGRCGAWTIQSFDARPGFAAAVAVEFPELTVQLRSIHSLDQLTS